MTSEITRQRDALKTLYGGSAKWCKKVNLMPPAQVTALYLKFKRESKLA